MIAHVSGMEVTRPMTDEFAEVRARFEHAVILILSALIAVLVVLAMWAFGGVYWLVRDQDRREDV